MWGLSGAVITRDGRNVPTAEILAALGVDGGSQIRRDLPGLRFSRLTVEAKLLISGSFPDRLSMQAVVEKGPTRVPLVAAGHIVIAGTWHALDAASAEAALALAGPGHQVPLTAGRYLKLLSQAPTLTLIDEVSHDRASDWGKTAQPLREPDEVDAVLYPYQAVGSTAMRVLAKHDIGTLLADEMGLGKTLQAIVLIAGEKNAGPSLVIAPASLLPNWARELTTFAPRLNVLIHAGPRRTGVPQGLAGHDVVVTSYETVVNDVSIFEDQVWNVVVLDEAQLIRNPDAQRSVVVKSLTRRVSVAVTGTPMENHLQDLWSVGEFVLPEALGDREQFKSDFPNEVEAAEVVGGLIAPVTIRRRVSEVARDLPARIDVVTALELDTRDEAALEEAADGASFLASLTRAQVICAHADEGAADPVTFAERPKVEHTLRLVTEANANGDKVLVFASYQSTLDRLAAAVRAVLPTVFVGVVDGRVEANERQHIIDAFSHSEEGGVLLLNPRAAGVGLNITAANHVIHFNPEWNPAVTAQATARAHRRHQSKPVFVHHLFYKESVEESVVDTAEFKRELAAGVDTGIAEGGIVDAG